MQYQSLFLDIDGTLINSKGEITPKTKEAIMRLQEKGVPVVLTSGRPHQGMVRYAKELNSAGFNGYVVSFNGGKAVYMPTNTVMHEICMPMPLVEKVFALTKELGLHVLTYNEEGIVSESPEYCYVQHESKLTNLPVFMLEDGVNSLTCPVNKCLVVGEPEDIQKAQEVFKQKLGSEVTVACSAPFYLEVTPNGVDKAKGIEAVLQALNLTKETAVGCGDSFTDVAMLQYVGLGVAVENAPQAIKDMCGLVVASNENDGVAQAIAHCWQI